MKKLIAFISAFFVLFSTAVNAAYTGAELYNSMEKAFAWIADNVSPLGDTDSVAADYYVMALKRAGKIFDFNKYTQVTSSKKPATNQDAQRIIMANTASGGRMSEDFVSRYTYNAKLETASDYADAITAILSGEYKVRSHNTDINKLAVSLLGMQNIDGGFDGNVLSTSKSIIALSFLSGSCYIVKGEEIGEKYRYDVNTAILRGVNYLQNNKADDFGFGNPKNTAYAVMALDSAGVDADNDPGFSDGEKSTLNSLMNLSAPDGRIGKTPDDTALALCAIVSHLRAMQGNSMFFALLTEDMPYNPNEYIEDISRSGEGLKVETQDEIEVFISTHELTSGDADEPYRLSTPMPVENEPQTHERKTIKIQSVVVIIVSVVVLTAVVAWFVVYMLGIKLVKKYHKKESKDEDD